MFKRKKYQSILAIVNATLFTFCLSSIPLKAEAVTLESTKAVDTQSSSSTDKSVQDLGLNNKLEASANVSTNQGSTEKYKDGEFIIKFKEGISSQILNDVNVAKKELNEKTASFGAEVLSVKNLGDTGSKLAKYKGIKDPAELAKALKSKYGNSIEYVEPNYILKASDIKASWVPSDTYYSSLWGLKNTGQYISGQYGVSGIDIKAEKAWDITKGSSNIVVAVIDSGVDYTHPDLKNNMWKNTKEIPNNYIDDDKNGYVDDVNGWDFYWSDNDPMDDNRHGTHVAGTIAASGNYTGVVGVAPNVKIMPLKFLNSTGNGYLSDAVMAISYANKMGAKISNNSWGGSGYSSTLYSAIQNYSGLFVAAAGNDTNNNDLYGTYPASFNLPNILSVAAIDNRGSLASFSNYGTTSVDVAAPGVSIYSTTPGGGYQYLNGTSMATPHVAGVAALVLSKNPLSTTSKVKEAITKSVVKLSSLNGKVATGGLVNAYAAVTANVPVPTSVTAVSTGYNSIRTSWKAAAGVSGYEIFRSTSSTGTYSLVGTTTSTSYTNTGLNTGAPYYYKVRSYVMVGTAKVYGGFSAVVGAKPVPATPTVPSAISTGFNSIKVSWNTVPGASGYEIYMYSILPISAASDKGEDRVNETAVTSYTYTGLITGIPYYYKIRAYRMVGATKVYGSYSTEVNAKPTLSTSASFTAARLSSTSIKLAWSPVSGSSGYEVYRATSINGTYSKVTATAYTSYTNANLTTGVTYYYKVRAYRTVGTTKFYSGWTYIRYAKP